MKREKGFFVIDDIIIIIIGLLIYHFFIAERKFERREDPPEIREHARELPQRFERQFRGERSDDDWRIVRSFIKPDGRACFEIEIQGQRGFELCPKEE